MTLKFVAAIFSEFNPATCRFDEITVPLAEVEAYHARTKAWVIKVVAEDGFVSWGKSWIGGQRLRDGSPNPMYGKIVRIGAGAYGDVPVWEAAR